MHKSNFNNPEAQARYDAACEQKIKDIIQFHIDKRELVNPRIIGEVQHVSNDRLDYFYFEVAHDQSEMTVYFKLTYSDLYHCVYEDSNVGVHYDIVQTKLHFEGYIRHLLDISEKMVIKPVEKKYEERILILSASCWERNEAFNLRDTILPDGFLESADPDSYEMYTIDEFMNSINDGDDIFSNWWITRVKVQVS